MKNILDLRFVIGAFFLLVGLFLLIGSFVLHPEGDKTETVNRLCGLLYIIFSVVVLLLWKMGKKDPASDVEE